MYTFVYGTLMKGYRNHKYYLGNNETSKFIGNGKLKGYTMYHVSNFPGIVEDCNDYVLGELYEINK